MDALQPDPQLDTREALGWALHELAVAGASVDTVIGRNLGVSASDYLAIKHVMVHKQGLGPAELGRLLGISSGSATMLVDRLARAGLLNRVTHPSDRRRVRLALSAHAEETILSRLAPLADEITRLSAEFEDAEIVAITRFLQNAALSYDALRSRIRPD